MNSDQDKNSDQDNTLKTSPTAAMPAEHAVRAVPVEREAAAVEAEYGPHRKVLQTDSIAQTVNPRMAKTGGAKPAAAHSGSNTAAASTTASPVGDVSRSESSDELFQLEQSEKLNGMIASSSRAFGKPGK